VTGEKKMLDNVNRIDSASDGLIFVPSEDLRVVRAQSLYERRLKRPFDIVLGSFFLLLSSPAFLGVAVAVRFGLGKSVLYSQQRIGVGGAPFTIYKFRTMRPDRRQSEVELPDDTDRRNTHKDDNDPRHTGFGRLLRKLSLDELPQLINVLRGEMSLVGPRPELVGVAKQRGYLRHVRHEVRPGMTGPYQVSDLRYNGDLRDGLELDVEYVNSLTFGSDLRFLARTIIVMLGASSGS
jgi:lipopolysaccharide/colanic/teichoic acid biosynthesis glycosyltransferase